MLHMMRRCETTRSGASSVALLLANAHVCTSEQNLQRQLSLTKNQLRDLRSSHESNQAKLLDHTQRQGVCPFNST